VERVFLDHVLGLEPLAALLQNNVALPLLLKLDLTLFHLWGGYGFECQGLGFREARSDTHAILKRSHSSPQVRV
jgi:hypothetical protein